MAMKAKQSVVPPETQALAKRMTTSAERVCADLNALVIKTEQDAEQAQDILKRIKGSLLEVEQREKEITKPLNTALRACRALFKPVKETLRQGEFTLKQKIVSYFDERARQQEAEAEKKRLALEKEAKKLEKKGKAVEALALREQTVEVEKPKTEEGVTLRKIWSIKITNPDTVPRHLCSPDTAKIKAQVTGNEEKINEAGGIDGLLIEQISNLGVSA